MTDIVVTVPMNFTYDLAPGLKGLAAWAAEGDKPGDPWSGQEWEFTTWGTKPDIAPGERVYVVCERKLRGYAPLVRLEAGPCRGRNGAGSLTFVRAGGAVAVTIPETIVGFRGWRYRWWEREVEVPFPDWLADAQRQATTVVAPRCESDCHTLRPPAAWCVTYNSPGGDVFRHEHLCTSHANSARRHGHATVTAIAACARNAHVLTMKRTNADDASKARRALIAQGHDIHSATCTCDRWHIEVGTPDEIRAAYEDHVREVSA